MAIICQMKVATTSSSMILAGCNILGICTLVYRLKPTSKLILYTVAKGWDIWSHIGTS